MDVVALAREAGDEKFVALVFSVGRRDVGFVVGDEGLVLFFVLVDEGAELGGEQGIGVLFVGEIDDGFDLVFEGLVFEEFRFFGVWILIGIFLGFFVGIFRGFFGGFGRGENRAEDAVEGVGNVVDDGRKSGRRFFGRIFRGSFLGIFFGVCLGIFLRIFLVFCVWVFWGFGVGAEG